MKDLNSRVVKFQWVVIAVLVIGAGIGGYMLYSKNNDLQAQVDSQTGNTASLQNQLKEAKASSTPVADESALPASTKNLTPSGAPTATPKVSPTPVKAP